MSCWLVIWNVCSIKLILNNDKKKNTFKKFRKFNISTTRLSNPKSIFSLVNRPSHILSSNCVFLAWDVMGDRKLHRVVSFSPPSPWSPFPSFLDVCDPDTLKRAGLFCVMTLHVGLSGVSWWSDAFGAGIPRKWFPGHVLLGLSLQGHLISVYSTPGDVCFDYWITVASARLLWHGSFSLCNSSLGFKHTHLALLCKQYILRILVHWFLERESCHTSKENSLLLFFYMCVSPIIWMYHDLLNSL